MNNNEKFIDFKNFKNHTEAQQLISSNGFSGQMPFIILQNNEGVQLRSLSFQLKFKPIRNYN